MNNLSPGFITSGSGDGDIFGFVSCGVSFSFASQNTLEMRKTQNDIFKTLLIILRANDLLVEISF